MMKTTLRSWNCLRTYKEVSFIFSSGCCVVVAASMGEINHGDDDKAIVGLMASIVRIDIEEEGGEEEEMALSPVRVRFADSVFIIPSPPILERQYGFDSRDEPDIIPSEEDSNQSTIIDDWEPCMIDEAMESDEL